jgi:hypothetical protein
MHHPPSSTGSDGAGAIGAGHTARAHIEQRGRGRAGLAAGSTVVHTCQEVNWLLEGATCRWVALARGALGDGVAVVGIAVRLGLAPWQLVQVILEELVASRPVLIALQPGGKAESCVCSVNKSPSTGKNKQSKGLTEHLQPAARR